MCIESDNLIEIVKTKKEFKDFMKKKMSLIEGFYFISIYEKIVQ